jgi:hypothetical protein
LAQHDGNADGVIDVKDVVFKDLRVWVDANSNGQTDAGELRTLQDLAITSINLQHDGQMIEQGENLLAYKSSFTTADGATHEAWDAWLTTYNLELDLDRVTSTLDNGVKTLQLADGLAQQVTIHLQDVLSAPAQADGQHTLVVNADVADIVRLGQLLPDGTTSPGQWTAAGTSAVNDKTYDVFHNSADHGVQVLIEQNLLNPVQFTG